MENPVQVPRRERTSRSNPARTLRESHRPQDARRPRESHVTKAAGNAGSRNSRRRTRKVTQGALPFRSWGGARKGAGRKRKADRPRIPHRPRPGHARSAPVQVTSRLVPGLGSLRNAAELAIVRDALARSQRGEFRVVHHSIQSNHLHLIVEADDRGALTAGLRGLLVRIAGALNRLWHRRGGVFADRFHERELRTPREVRNSLLYVLQNARKHGIWMRGADPCSSGADFDGWEDARDRESVAGSGSAQSSRRGSRKERPEAERWVKDGREKEGLWRRARTWLLGVGWQRHGLLRESEVPHGAFGSIVCVRGR